MARGGAVSFLGKKDDATAESARAAKASEALALVDSDPSAASKLARHALAQAEAAGDSRAISMAERALGAAAQELHDLPSAAAHLRRAVLVAEAAGLHTCAAEARMGLMGTLALQGDYRAALREGDRAAPVLQGVTRARLRVQRAHVHAHCGQLDEALDGFRGALPVLRRAGDRFGEAGVYEARAMTHYFRGAVAAAESDLRRAEALLVALGENRRAVGVRVHLGLAVALRGDIPEALAWFDRARELSAGAAHDAMALIDHSEVLLGARLVGEARASAEIAVATLADEGQPAYLAIARLKLAEAALAAGDLRIAGEMAELAQAAFVDQGRRSWAALARQVAVRAAWLSGDRSTTLLAAARESAARLASAGVTSSSFDARLLAAQLALELGRPEVAREELDAARHARRRGPVQLRVRAWHAEALLRLADGNRRGAESALLAGVRLVERYRAALGATELRAHASGHAFELARLGLRLAIADGNAERTLNWIERWRAGSLRLRPALPPDDTALATALSELKAVVTKADAAALAGRPTAQLRARQATLEETVRNRARFATGVLAAVLRPPPTADEIKAAVGGHALVEITDDGGVFHAVVVSGGRTKLRRLAPVAQVVAELERLRFSLRRLAFGQASSASLAAARDATVFGAKQLDALLLEPLVSEIGNRPLVVIPTGQLYAVPWSLLPTCSGRPLSVAPSASLWLRATESDERREGGIVLVAGPDLEHALPEVAALARRYPRAVRLTGRRATCKAVCAALDGADLAHLATHGRFRADNPLFSSLQLVDGPLTVYDLEALRQAPRTLVLSACDSGVSDVQPADELMGLAAAVFALGTRTLIASVFPVPDAATRRLMLAVHGGLRAGLPPARALARAQSRLATAGPAEMAAAAAFMCFGSGSAAMPDVRPPTRGHGAAADRVSRGAAPAVSCPS